jgi:hypothetical protein
LRGSFAVRPGVAHPNRVHVLAVEAIVQASFGSVGADSELARGVAAIGLTARVLFAMQLASFTLLHTGGSTVQAVAARGIQ